MNNKILFIVRTYCAPDVRVERETRSLTANGYDVETFCLGDNVLPKQETWDGGLIKRIINMPIEKGSSILMKVYSVILFAFYTIWNGRKYSIVHCNDLDMLPIGIFLKWSTLNRIKVVYDAHEYETEKFHTNGYKKTFSKWVEKVFIGFADATLTVSEAIASEYAKLYPNLKRPSVVLNCPPMKDITGSDILRKNLKIPKNNTVFLYQGGLFPNRGIEMILDAFCNIKDKTKIIIFMGFGPLEKAILEKTKSEPNIFFHESVSTKVLHNYTASADVGIIYYQNTCLNHYYCSPNKLFEYIMAGLPVIASDLYELRRILTDNNNGTVVANDDSRGLVKAINKYDSSLIKTQRKNSTKLRNSYSWEQQEDVLLAIYKSLSA